jgi:hypothetical protein
MHNGHPYALQSAAFFIAMIPFAALFVLMIGARFFDGLRRARKPVPARRPGIIGMTAFAASRRFVPAAD